VRAKFGLICSLVSCGGLRALAVLGAFGFALATPGNAAAQVDCSFSIHLDDAVSVGAIQYDLDYSGTGGDINGTGGSVDCTDLTSSIANFFDDDAGTVNAAYLSFAGFNGPTDLATCNMTAPSVPTGTDFVVTVSDATDPFTITLDSLPGASVTDISCTGGGSTTTTTLGGTTTTSTTSTTSTTFPGSPFCWVRISMTTNETLGSFQYELDYTGANGEFEGSGSGVTCENMVSGSISTMADNDMGTIGVAVISLSGFTGPTDITRCVWLPSGADPLAEDYAITIIDASDTGANPVIPSPLVEISDISCFAGTTTTTTSTSTTTTTLAPFCGDGVINLDDECDDGGGNSDTLPDTCRTDCTLPLCGDAVTDTGEGCDDGPGNSDVDADACRTDCTPAACGDSVVDSAEECDLGPGNNPEASNGCYDDCIEYMLCGDANADLRVTAPDAQQVLQAGVGLIEDCPLRRCDPSQDGVVTAGDAQRVLSGAVGLTSLDCE